MADLILGTAALGGKAYAGLPAIEAADAIELVRRAYKLGIRHFETSWSYGSLTPLLQHLREDGNGRPVIFLKSGIDWSGKVFSHGEHADFVEMVHNYDGKRPLPSWAAGFSCYSHDNVRSAPGMIVQQDWSLLNQSTFPEGCTYKMARSVFLRGALAQNHQQRQWALQAALHAADGVVIGPRSIAELEELVEIANPPHSTPWIPLEVLNLGLHPMTDLRTWPPK